MSAAILSSFARFSNGKAEKRVEAYGGGGRLFRKEEGGMAMRRKAKRIVRAALIKAQSAWGDVKGNIRLLEGLCEGLTDSKIDVVITPECFLDGYMVREKKRCTRRKLATCTVSGWKDPMVKRAARLAAGLSSYVVFGASERDAAGVIRNAAYLIGRKGEPVGVYYKTHPCGFYVPGDDLAVFETDFGVVGIVICADRRWPENIRVMRLAGAEIILNPTWGLYGDLNTAIMRTRAYENGIPVCFAHPDQSLVCLPDGEIGAALESNVPGVLVHDIDLGKNPKAGTNKDKAASHPVRNRRPELYGKIVERAQR